MIKLGQIDTKNQYGLKRKKFHENDMEYGSLHWGKQQNNNVNNNFINKPLQGGVQTQISFKGFNFNNSLTRPVTKIVHKNVTKKVFDALSHISDEQFKNYSQIREKFVDFLNSDAQYRKSHGITDEILNEINNNKKLIYLPKKTVFVKFLNQVVSPFKFIYSGVEKLVLKNKPELLKKKQEKEKILKDYAALEGLMKSLEIWENGYRKVSGHKKLVENEKFLIPDDVLYSKIQRRRNKIVDPNKGKYSSNSLMIGNRFISGVIYSYFLGTDAYNTTMRYSNDRHEASNQRKSRIAQEFSRIGLNMYIQNLLFGTFETAINKSLATAMFVAGSTTAFSEILGRKLVGKPIMPSDKDTLDRLESEMYEKKGVLPSIGRLLTNVKKKDNKTKQNDKNVIYYKKTNANKKTFSGFSKNNTKKANNSATSFKGYASVEKLIEKDKIRKIISALNKADDKIAANIKETITKSIEKSTYFEENSLKKPKTFEELMSNDAYQYVPMGTQNTFAGKLVSSFLVPVNFTKNIAKKSAKFIRKSFNSLRGKPNNELADELLLLGKSTNNKDIQRLKKFNDFYRERLKLDVWATSPLSADEKKLRIFSEFKSIKGKTKEDIEGVKNILLWLDKQILKENIKILPDGTMSEADCVKLKKILQSSTMIADSSKHIEYDGNTLAQTNINLSRAITTFFLVTDAYNLTMQYSGDNKKDANKSAKNRAAQEISRISVSAYIMAFVHNLLSKLCNSSLAGAFTLTALTSSINDSISRQVVGVPLTAKNQSELEDIDKKNLKSKSPIKKALAYSIGKKSAVSAKSNSVQVNYDFQNDDFFIKPEL